MNTSILRSTLALLTVSLIATGCAADDDDRGDSQEDVEATEGAIQGSTVKSVLLPAGGHSCLVTAQLAFLGDGNLRGTITLSNCDPEKAKTGGLRMGGHILGPAAFLEEHDRNAQCFQTGTTVATGCKVFLVNVLPSQKNRQNPMRATGSYCLDAIAGFAAPGQVRGSANLRVCRTAGTTDIKK